MNFLNDFKAFAVRGNVVDMAVGIIIGAAFGKIIAQPQPADPTARNVRTACRVSQSRRPVARIARPI